MPYNFTLIREEELNGISSAGFLYRHKTGAELLHIKNGDANKVFCVMFITLPENNTGVFHVLEHCVLCGSLKYPVKDPYNELSKGTLHTYLNAMTYRDKTLFPVAGTNERDFFKMTDVYLNAVFFPLIKQKREIMLQEGVNFRFDKKAGVTGYGGIVFNEMSGSFSEPEEYLKAKAYEKLFKGSPYMYDSGGLPDEIPSLTYEYLLKCHERYYTAGNSRFYIYGDMDAEKYLRHIDEEYLSAFDERSGYNAAASPVKIGNTFPDAGPFCFEITGKSKESRSVISVRSKEKNSAKLVTGLSVLCRYLSGKEASPLKRLIIEEKLGDVISYSLDFHIPRPTLNITVKNCAEHVLLKERIFNTVQDIAENGFDRELLNSCFFEYEFNLREENYGGRPKGLHYLITASPCWLYGRNPFEALKLSEALRQIQNDGSYLPGLMHDFFINNNAVATGRYVYSAGSDTVFDTGGEGRALKEAEDDARKLSLYQQNPDGEKQLSKIPLLSLSDIDEKCQDAPFEIDSGGRASLSRAETNGITYMKFLFDIDLPSPYVKNLSILSYLLGKLDTKNRTFDALSKKIAAHLGGMGFSHHFFTHSGSGNPACPGKPVHAKFMASVKTLDGNIGKAFEYTREVTQNTLFTDEKRIESLINEYTAQIRSRITSRGHLFAASYAAAPLRPSDMLDEVTSGITFYNYISSIKDIPLLCEELKNAYREIFTRENFSFHCIAQNDAALEHKEDFVKALNAASGGHCAFTDNQTAQNPAPEWRIKNKTRFVTDAKVSFNSVCVDYGAGGHKFSGCMNVLANILNSNLLMQKIRLKGGAYGFGGSFARRGLAAFYSYRDPNVDETFEVFNSMPHFVQNLNLTDRQLTQFIIGAVNSKDCPRYPNALGLHALIRYFCGITQEDEQRERDEILGTTKPKLRNLGGLLEAKPGCSNICSFGSGERESGLFENTVSV